MINAMKKIEVTETARNKIVYAHQKSGNNFLAYTSNLKWKA